MDVEMLKFLLDREGERCYDKGVAHANLQVQIAKRNEASISEALNKEIERHDILRRQIEVYHKHMEERSKELQEANCEIVRLADTCTDLKNSNYLLSEQIKTLQSTLEGTVKGYESVLKKEERESGKEAIGRLLNNTRALISEESFAEMVMSSISALKRETIQMIYQRLGAM